MKDTSHPNIPIRILACLIGVTLVLLVIHVTLQYVNLNLLNEEFGPFYELTNRFDLDDEISVGTWVSQTMLLVLAGSAALAGMLTVKKSQRTIWLLLAIFALIGSVDEGAGLHEFVLQSAHNVFFVDQVSTITINAWWILLPLITTVALWFLWKVQKNFTRRTLLLFSLGVGLFIGGAALIDIATSYESNSPFIKQGILVAIEEGLELTGLSVLIYTVVDYLQRNHAQQIQSAWKYLKTQA